MQKKKIGVLLIACVIALVIAIGAVGAGYLFGQSEQDRSLIVFENKEFIIERAETQETRTRGLSGRVSLPEHHGLLFDFFVEGDYGFWMKDMNFSIDMLWINSEREVVHIEHDVAPDTYPTLFHSSEPARFVLEINAQLTEKYDIDVGDKADFYIPPHK